MPALFGRRTGLLVAAVAVGGMFAWEALHNGRWAQAARAELRASGRPDAQVQRIWFARRCAPRIRGRGVAAFRWRNHGERGRVCVHKRSGNAWIVPEQLLTR